MKEILNKTLRKLLCSGLIIAMVLFNSIAIFAIDEMPEDQSHDDSTVSDINIQEEPQAQPASSSETAEAEPSEPDPEPAAAETATTSAVPDQGGPEETACINEEVSADTEVPEQPAGESDTAVEKVTAPSEPAGSAAKTASAATAGSSAGKKIHIGDTSFDSGDDESSHWSDGKGWKNIAGQYIAMVDFKGSEEEISADEGVITLAVAGVNRIGALKGNCSYNIVGSGIVLIDSIDIEDGNGISLMPNTAIYDEGSAAVFLKHDDSYVLINGSIPGILDETYTLDGVNLVVPDGSSLKLGAMCVRTETWVPDGSDEPVTDVTYYMTDMPAGSGNPTHKNGIVRIMDCGSRLVIGENSTLTVDSEASVHLNKLRSQNVYLEVGNPIIAGELIIQGAMNVIGAVTGGYIEVQDGGSLSGTGAIKSSGVDLQPAGSLDVPLEDSILTVNANSDGSNRAVALTVKDSTIYLRGTGIDISNLNVSGSSTLSIDTRDSEYDPYNKVGNIVLAEGGNLDVTVNKYDPVSGIGHYNEEILNNERDGLTDSFLEIYGGITGGTVSVLAGCVKYTGIQSGALPAVPVGYASRVLVNGIGTETKLYPLNMNRIEANLRASLDEIPVMGCVVFDDWDTEKGMYRVWRVDEASALGTLSRSSTPQVTYPDLLKMYGLLDENGQIRSKFNVAVEIIYSDFSRRLLKSDDYYPASAISENTQWTPIPLNNVIMVRVLQYMATGGFGGSTSTHTIASVTGSGVIGSPGSGHMKAGNGAVIYGVKYEEPVPVDPDPVKPEPVNPAPKKTEKHDTNNSGSEKNGSNSRIARVDSVKTVSAVNDAGLVVSVSPWELTAEEAAKHPDMLQIWQLGITDGGTAVTDLSGAPVKVTLPFTIPESWGDPAEIDDDSLYAVFADEGELSAYKAEYEPETGEVSFETEQAGNFVIVQFKYGDKPFTEEFYKSLAELKEIKDYLAVMNR